MNLFRKIFNWFTLVEQTTDSACKYCRGLGYDASAMVCTCVKEKK